MSTLRHYTPACSGRVQASGSSWRRVAASQPSPKGSQPHVIGHASQPEGNNFLPIGNSSQSSQSTGRHQSIGGRLQEDEGPRWPHGHQGQRHHLLLPKALPQGNLSRYFDLACVTSGLRCLNGQQDAWRDAWLVLQHAVGHITAEGTHCKDPPHPPPQTSHLIMQRIQCKCPNALMPRSGLFAAAQPRVCSPCGQYLGIVCLLECGALCWLCFCRMTS